MTTTATPNAIPAAHPAAISDWLARVDARQTHVAVIGLGYVGLPLALLFSDAGFRVTGFDIDAAKVVALNGGGSYIHRIEPVHIAAAQRAGFRATTDFAALAGCDAVLICVPTPLAADHTPDMSFVTSTIEAIAPHTRSGQLIVLESTTWPGTTTELVVPMLERFGPEGTVVLRQEQGLEEQGLGIREQGLEAGGGEGSAKAGKTAANDLSAQPMPSEERPNPCSLIPVPCLERPNPCSLIPDPCLSGLMVAFSPEREDPGNRTTPRREIPKVIGGVDGRATHAAAALYGSIFDRTIAMSSPDAAEMTKLLENIYRGVNIALVNEMKQLCLAMGIDIWEVIDAAATKPFGFAPFYPGPGIGGHCIPVDPFYLSWRARQFNQPTRFIELAGEVNEAMPAFVVQTVERALQRAGRSLSEAKVLLLGIAYKADVDDLRESPALTIFSLLQGAGAEVSYHDPFFAEVGAGRHYSLKLHCTPLDRVAEFDCVLLVTDHSAYNIGDLVAASRLFIDTRNATRGLSAPNIVRC